MFDENVPQGITGWERTIWSITKAPQVCLSDILKQKVQSNKIFNLRSKCHPRNGSNWKKDQVKPHQKKLVIPYTVLFIVFENQSFKLIVKSYKFCEIEDKKSLRTHFEPNWQNWPCYHTDSDSFHTNLIEFVSLVTIKITFRIKLVEFVSLA